MWAILSCLTVTSVAAAALNAAQFGVEAARLPIAPEPHWGWWLRHQWYEPMGYASIAAPLLAAGALLLRRWRVATLSVLAVAALFQVTALLLEYRWKEQERAGEFERPSLLDTR